MEREDFALGGSAGFMLGVAYRSVQLLLQQRLKPYGVTPEQWCVLFHVVRQEGLMQKELAEQTGKDRPTVTRILDALETKGLIRKQTGKEDRRAFYVYPTEKGRALNLEAEPIERKLNEEVREALGAAEYEAVVKALGRIRRYAEPLLEHE